MDSRPSTSSSDPRPPSTSTMAAFDVIESSPAPFQSVNHKDAKTVKNLLDKGALERGVNSNRVQNHLNQTNVTTQKEGIDGQGQSGRLNSHSRSYLRYNRMQQEQCNNLKLNGPNYLAAIMAKPKARLPDCNEEDISVNDDDNVEVDDAENSISRDDNLFGSNDPLESELDPSRGSLQPGTMNTINSEFESFDYTETSSALRYRSGSERTASSVAQEDTYRWPIAFFIGVFTAIIAFTIQTAIGYVTHFKYHILSVWFQETYEQQDAYISYFLSVGINILFCALAAICCVFAPEAVGSGIPQIKSYLNGVNMPRIMRFKTLLGKIFGVICSVSGGLAVGKEGPMIHSGAIVAAGLSQGKATSLPITTKYNKAYRNDREKRDFVACGAAAGVAAAFGAPLGGLLFAIEEGASHINHSTLWRVAMSSIVSFFTLNIITSVVEGFAGQLSNGGLISFGEFDDAAYNLFQLIIFILMAVFGGLSGSFFNALNAKLTKYRIRKVTTNFAKTLEVIICGIIVASMAFCMMLMVNDCRSYDVDINNSPVRLFCQDGKASAAASLWYKTPEETVKSLFHDKPGAHSFTTLFVFTVIYFFLACWTYGMTISSGLFVPSILIGAGWGRLTGMLLFVAFPQWDWGDLGKYALIGASAQLAGTIRLTYSLTAIILEATGNLTYIFPVFVTVFVSKIIGDFVNEGLYDIHINILGIPVLPYQPKVELRTITAKDMMNDKVKFLMLRSKVKDILDLLRHSTHNAFPIVDTPSKTLHDGSQTYGRMRGIMKRHDIVTMLANGIYVDNGRFGSAESYETLRERYPRFMQLEEFHIPDSYANYIMDFSNAMDSAPYTAQSTMCMPAVYMLFRNIGMRHLVVTNFNNEVVGMITRHEIAALEPEFTPFPKSKITLYKKTSVLTQKKVSPAAAAAAAAKSYLEDGIRRRSNNIPSTSSLSNNSNVSNNDSANNEYNRF